MFIRNLKDFKLRLLRIAAEHLKNKSYVCPLDIPTNIGVIQPIHIEEWKSGEIPYLEYVFDKNLPKIRRALRWICEWACNKSVRKESLGCLVGERSFCLRCGDSLT